VLILHHNYLPLNGRQLSGWLDEARLFQNKGKTCSVKKNVSKWWRVPMALSPVLQVRDSPVSVALTHPHMHYKSSNGPWMAMFPTIHRQTGYRHLEVSIRHHSYPLLNGRQLSLRPPPFCEELCSGFLDDTGLFQKKGKNCSVKKNVSKQCKSASFRHQWIKSNAPPWQIVQVKTRNNGYLLFNSG
jgi:hypothetical protein